MEDALDAFHGAIERRDIPQIPGYVFERQIRNRAIRARRAHDTANAIAAGNDLPRNVAPQEAGRACDQRGHDRCTVSSQDWAGSISMPETRRLSDPLGKVASPRSTSPESQRHCTLGMRRRTTLGVGERESLFVSAVISQ